MSIGAIDKVAHISMLADSAATLRPFLPEDPQADDAAFAILNTLFALFALFALEDYGAKHASWST